MVEKNISWLAGLPNEILSLIVSNLEHPRDVVHLALANRRLHKFVQLDGWREYLKRRFGISGRQDNPQTAVHGLTSLYRSWEKKAFVARYISPASNTISLNTWAKEPRIRQQAQTMGYRPSIDSYEQQEGNWVDRREVLAWAAGTEIVLRVKETGPKSSDLQNRSDDSSELNAYNHSSAWYTYSIPRSIEGRDDISSLKIIRPEQKHDNSEHIVFGTASGNISVLEVDFKARTTQRRQYATNEDAVHSLSVSPGKEPLLAAHLGNSNLALYSLALDASADEKSIEPTNDTQNPVSITEADKIWSCNFLSGDMVALGLGSTHEPIQIYGVTPAGFSNYPLRKFGFGADERSGLSLSAYPRTSVYPIVALPTASRAGSGEGMLFLSGAYDGLIRLHDMRSPNNFEAVFVDVTNDSPLYSLITHGQERIIAGTSMHSMIKVFDLRMSGSHAYQSISIPGKPNKRGNANEGDYVNQVTMEAIRNTGTKIETGGWNLFLQPREHPGLYARSRPPRDSPVYSLSLPSATSPSLYAGLEGRVIGIDFHSVTDQHPDPFFTGAVERDPVGMIDVERSYNRNSDILDLAMYEQGEEGALDMRLLRQKRVENGILTTKRPNPGRYSGLDERWMDPRDDERDRWARGQQPQDVPQGRRGRGGRGGRGRGRGRGATRAH